MKGGIGGDTERLEVEGGTGLEKERLEKGGVNRR